MLKIQSIILYLILKPTIVRRTHIINICFIKLNFRHIENLTTPSISLCEFTCPPRESYCNIYKSNFLFSHKLVDHLTHNQTIIIFAFIPGDVKLGSGVNAKYFSPLDLLTTIEISSYTRYVGVLLLRFKCDHSSY